MRPDENRQMVKSDQTPILVEPGEVVVVVYKTVSVPLPLELLMQREGDDGYSIDCYYSVVGAGDKHDKAYRVYSRGP